MEMKLPLILDGATGTQLQKRGYTGEKSAEEWVLAHPEAIQEVQREYVAAGSQIVYAPTFGANRVKLEEHGIFNKVAEYNEKLVALSKEAVDGKAWVAGDISPTGHFLSPLGDYSFDELVDIYTEQAEALEATGVDLYVVETMMTVSDARAAVLAIRSVSRKPILVTFTCDEHGKTVAGSDICAVLQIMQGMEIDAFGLNCSVGPDGMLHQFHRMKHYAQVPLIAKPNAGSPMIVDGQTVYHCPPDEFTAHVQEFAGVGVAVFGGCCGTEAQHIQALQEKLQGGLALHRPDGQGELLPAATEKTAHLLRPEIACGTVYACDENLEDVLEELDESDAETIAIAIRSEEELDLFADCQYAITRPLFLVCDDAALLEQALRLYQGRALYEGSLPEEALAPLGRRYGLIY